MRQVRPRLAWTWLVFSLMSGPVLAYILPATFLLDQMADKRSKMGVQSLRVSLECKTDQQPAHEEVLYLKVPGRVRRERGERVVEVCKVGSCFLKRGDEKPFRLSDWAYLPYLYFVEGDAKGSRYLGLLESLKVNVEVDTITRFHARIAVVIGAKSWERDRPQLWIDKDRFLPLRLMVKDGSALLDIQWIGWGSKTGGDWFPDVLEIQCDGKLIERCEVTEVKSGGLMPDELFNL